MGAWLLCLLSLLAVTPRFCCTLRHMPTTKSQLSTQHCLCLPFLVYSRVRTMRMISLARPPGLLRLALAARPRLAMRPCHAAPASSVSQPARRSQVAPLATAASGGATAPGGNATGQLQDAFGRLAGTEVVLVASQHPVDITSLWSEDERCVLVFGRHMVSTAEPPVAHSSCSFHCTSGLMLARWKRNGQTSVILQLARSDLWVRVLLGWSPSLNLCIPRPTHTHTHHHHHHHHLRPPSLPCPRADCSAGSSRASWRVTCSQR